MNFAILLYEGFTALDAVGPYEVFARLPDASITFVARTSGAVTSDTGTLQLMAPSTLSETNRPDVAVIPGGPGQVQAMEDEAILSWVREVHAASTWTTSVCTGSLILAAAGILRGRRATSHWLALEQLTGLGATPVAERVVFDGKVVTAAGVSAGIDLALALAGRIAGPRIAQTIQLAIEYDPAPPYAAGSPATAPPQVTEYLRTTSRFVLQGGETAGSRPSPGTTQGAR